MTVAQELDENLLLKVSEAARILRISRNLTYELIARGEIPCVRFGRVIRVPRQGLEQWIERQSSLSDSPSEGVSLRMPRHRD
jgi:excisionase family DNA binding protein